jgi:hypothetical protein
LEIAASALRLQWSAFSEDVPMITGAGLGIARKDGVTRIVGGVLDLATSYGRAHLTDFEVDAGAERTLAGAHARTVDVHFSRQAHASEPSPSSAATDSRGDSGSKSSSAEASLAVELARVAALDVAANIARHLQPLASVRIDGASLEVVGRDAPITIGPGKLVVERSAEAVRVEYATGKDNDGTPLALTATIPLDATDVALSLEGGPVSLGVLGLRDGAGGLVDTARATVAGKARIVASPDSMTFDGDLRVRNASAQISRLASEPIRGIDAGIQARGTASAGGALRLDDIALSLGSLTISGSGGFEPFADHAELHFHGEVARASCQALLDSMPTALIPTLRGVRYSGAFSARGSFAANTSDLDHLELDYDVDDGCRVVDVPPELARERFTRPFTYRIYHPDGSSGEVTTGPGAPGWVPFGEISPFMIVAVMTTEDGGFYRHHGFSRGAIRSALIDNLKARRFVRGASTVSMQLAKNLFLTREKTVGRKLEEVVLTDYLEQTFTKDELMELYLNVIEFGPDVYGIGPAARDYFGRSASELNLAESLFLSSVLPSPLKLHALKFADHLSDGWQRTLAHLMSISHRSGLISQAELDQGRDETVFFHNTGPRPPARRFDDSLGAEAGDETTPAVDESN